MGRRPEKDLVRHITLEELNKLIRNGEKSVRVIERLYFIRFLYKGGSIREACEKVEISEPTGYSWLNSWNERGHDGLVPAFSGGPKPKLGNDERIELRGLLEKKDAWTLREVRILIRDKFGVDYSEMQVWRIMKSWNMHHTKPYVLDNRRPDDAENNLKKI